MPGPAPPSASYALKIVDSSDEEYEESEDEELEDLQRQVRLQEQALERMQSNTDVEESLTPAHLRSDSMEHEIENSTSPPKKKKKKKKLKKKKKVPTTSAATATATATATKKSVSFHQVTLHSFQRCLGTDVVPYDGGWPLGLGVAVGPPETLPVDQYEHDKQDRLRLRATQKGLDLPVDKELETRQWDYKHKTKNPLFHLLLEHQRMEILLEDSTPLHHDTDKDKDKDDSNHSSSNNNNSPSKRNSGSSTTKNNNSSSNSPNKKHNQGHHYRTRSRSHSFSSQQPSQQPSQPTQPPPERYNDTYSQVLVHHVRNELEELRFHRDSRHIGCHCRKLDVYLLPPNAGKKAHHRRLNVKRVKEELKKRHLLPATQLTREELELLLHDAVQQESCCSSQDCECARNGIQCQADVCTCWHDSHQTKGAPAAGAAGASCSVAEIQARCGNGQGMYAVDFQRIEQTRQDIFQKLKQGEIALCSPTNNTTTTTSTSVVHSFVSMVMG